MLASVFTPHLGVGGSGVGSAVGAVTEHPPPVVGTGIAVCKPVVKDDGSASKAGFEVQQGDLVRCEKVWEPTTYAITPHPPGSVWPSTALDSTLSINQRAAKSRGTMGLLSD